MEQYTTFWLSFQADKGLGLLVLSGGKSILASLIKRIAEEVGYCYNYGWILL